VESTNVEKDVSKLGRFGGKCGGVNYSMAENSYETYTGGEDKVIGRKTLGGGEGRIHKIYASGCDYLGNHYHGTAYGALALLVFEGYDLT